MSLDWEGEAVLARVNAAARFGVDRTIAKAVVHAKLNHPGWNNVTGLAEGSIRATQFATQVSPDRVVGRWGSVEANYMIWLELKHGAALRSAAAVVYPGLADEIREAL